VNDKEMYKKVVHAAFLSRRKTLENNLVNYFKIPRESAKGILSECGIDEKARGETLSPEEFAVLADVVGRYLRT
jgi:16S rRNA (adenine1518-N6/adenine1519-N6)-dimethyltransferase